jgi:carbon starvation protein CstA
MEPEVKEIVPVLGGCFLLFVILVILIVTAVMAWAYCRIFAKAGYPWALGLLMLVPIANIVMPFVLAFGDWPVQKELRLLRQQQSKTAN